MALAQDSVIWINDKYGIAIDVYNGQYKIQGVTKYQRDGQDVLTWDWVHKSVWDADKKKRVVPEKANGVSGVGLGDKESAVAILKNLLKQIGAEPGGEIPF